LGEHSTEAKVVAAVGWSVGRRMSATNWSSTWVLSAYTSARRVRMVPSDRKLSQCYGQAEYLAVFWVHAELS